ncbi:MAG TPA: MarR family transcriptional regulator [Oscillatoriaceae cyanobacterium]
MSVGTEESLLPVIRALMECHTQVERLAARHIESLGLTPAQFDVVATLGDTAGMTCKELGEHTLITKGTLTPVLTRLEERGLVRRERGEQDCRQVIVSLTPKGEAVYRETFMPHVTFMRAYLAKMSPEHQGRLVTLLNELKGAFAE